MVRAGWGSRFSSRSTSRENAEIELATPRVFPRVNPPTRASSAIDLEPDAGAGFLGDAPPVRDLLDEVQAPPGVLIHRRDGCPLEPRTAVRHLHPDRVAF